METKRPISFIRNGIVRLPPGFRFHPTDEELVVQYLKRKAFSCPLPAAVIPEINLCNFDPWDLPGEGEGERYFFNLVDRSAFHRSIRATGSGYWKAAGKPKPVVATASRELVGMKRVLVFHKGKPLRGSATDWVMHEYCLPSNLAQRSNSIRCFVEQSKDWVVCRIFERRTDEVAENRRRRKRRFGNGRVELDPSCSSSSSCLTDLEEEEEEEGDEGSSKAIDSPDHV
ncbi:NAC domain-containing protein 83-like isoform X1 [Zingiber officinale]|uniref:NAC domain-containing protein 83-like isoform X1 n=2 Tax=Zingiber officinale TaxID=94328 RepID=UPI001C4C1D75|nr:NAC domain-containing protein 83-like isoform X1 [Zingiber officinale]